MMGGVSIARGSVRLGKLLAIDAGDVRPGHGLSGEPTRDPSFDCPALWIAPSARDHAVAEGFLVVDPSTVIATHANQALLGEAHQLLGPDEVREWVDGLKSRAPALVEAVTPDPHWCTTCRGECAPSRPPNSSRNTEACLKQPCASRLSRKKRLIAPGM